MLVHDLKYLGITGKPATGREKKVFSCYRSAVLKQESKDMWVLINYSCICGPGQVPVHVR